MSKKLTHINRTMTEAERQQAEAIRAAAKQDYPPKLETEKSTTPSAGIPARIHDARKARGLTRYALGQLADVPAVVIRDIEQGADVPLSQLQTVARVLGLTVELVELSA
jgi:ribosome-binding protein aMBF1 (putative translation factor)